MLGSWGSGEPGAGSIETELVEGQVQEEARQGEASPLVSSDWLHRLRNWDLDQPLRQSG